MSEKEGRAVYLGVDGGGTKTAMAVIDSEGTLAAAHVAPGTHYLSLGLDVLGKLLATAVTATLSKSQLRMADVDFAFLGLSGHGEDSTLLDALNMEAGRLGQWTFRKPTGCVFSRRARSHTSR